MTAWQWYWIDRADSMKNTLFGLTVVIGLVAAAMIFIGFTMRENQMELSPQFVRSTRMLFWARRLILAVVIALILNVLIPESKTLCKMTHDCVWTVAPPPPPQDGKRR